MQNQFLVGAAAGAAASLLLLTQGSGTLMSVLAPLLAPLPVAVAGLGWGLRAIISALITSALTIALLSSAVDVQVGFVVVMFLLPISWMAYGFGLERQADDGSTEWFPQSWNMTIAIGVTAIVFILLNLAFGPSEEAIVEIVRDMIQAVEEQQNQPIIVSEENIAEIAQLMGVLLLGVPPASWFLINVGTLPPWTYRPPPSNDVPAPGSPAALPATELFRKRIACSDPAR